MKLKRSDYILTAFDNHGNLLLLNTFNQVFLMIPSEKKDWCIDFFKQSEIDDDSSNNFISEMKAMGFLIKKEFNEERRIEDLYIKKCHSNDALGLIVLPTEKCNFRCIYCYESYEKDKMNIKTQENVIKFVRRELKKYRSLNIGWFGGEPLLALDVVENLSKQFKAICKEQKKAFTASMTTNAYLLSLDTFKKLFDLNVLEYQITVDGVKSIHDKQRVLIDGTGTFDRIITNLKNIRDNIPSKLFRIKIRSNLLTTTDQDKMNEYWEFYKKEFGYDSRFEIQLKMTWDVTQNKEIEEKLFRPKEFNDLVKIMDTSPGTPKEPTAYVNNSTMIDWVTDSINPCYAAKSNSYVVGSDAELYKCTVSFDQDYNKIGKISDNGVAEIDQEKLLFFTTRSDNDRKICSKCPILPYCLGVKCPNVPAYNKSCKGLVISITNKMVIYSGMAKIINVEG